MFSEADKELKLLKDALVQHSVTVNHVGNTWSQIVEAIEGVKTIESGLDDKSRRTKHYCDKIVDNISVFGNWLELLPSGDYGAVVSGVFKMVVQVS